MNNSKLRSKLAVFMVMVLNPFINGCSPQREPVAIAIVLDKSGSAWEKRERGFEYLRTILQGQYLPKGSTLALTSCGRVSKVVWEGRIKSTAEILEAYQEAVQKKEEGGGTDVVTALELSRDWLTMQHDQGMKTMILTGWTDMQADPVKNGKRVVHAFKPASAMTWPGAKNVQVIMFGVAPVEAGTLQKQWAPSLATVLLYGPAHRIRPEDIGLTRGTTY